MRTSEAGHEWRSRALTTSIAALCALTGAGLLAGATRALAQEAVSPVTAPGTRLGDLYRLMRRDNPRVAVVQSLTRAAQARVPGVSRLPDPQLQFGFMNYALPSLVPMPTIGMMQLQLMQMVPLGGKLALSGRVADALAAAAGERAQDMVWELQSRTAMAFYDIHATDGQLEVARETLRLLQDIARTVEAMYRVGDGRQVDVLRAQVEIARMAEDTLRMQAMRQTMVARLNALLNRDAATEIARVARPAFPDTVPARAFLESLAVSNRPMIRAGLQEVRAAEAAALRARREIFPDLQVGVQYGQRESTMPATSPTGAPIVERGTDRMGSLMIGASIPVFASDRQFQMRTEADAMKAMADADLAAVRAETRGRIGEGYAALRRSRDLARLYRSTVLPQGEATVSSALSSYRVGRVDFMTLLDDQMAVNKYRQELFVLEAEEGKAWAELEMLVGRELLDPNTTAVASRAASTSKGGAR